MDHLVVKSDVKGSILVCHEGLSFWGGVDAGTGEVIDAYHQHFGQSLSSKIVLMPTSRGSCSGSGVLLELAMNGKAPSALVFREDEDVLTLGALIAEKMFSRKVAILKLSHESYDALAEKSYAEIIGHKLIADDLSLDLTSLDFDSIDLTPSDRRKLSGEEGPAVKLAMETISTMAVVQAAKSLIDVTRAHIDGCIYASPANLIFAEKVADMCQSVCIPTTMNAISVDHLNWKTQGIDEEFGNAASRLANAYVKMGAKANFTCAPYQASDAPSDGENIGWSESNAVIYANSVLGARTAKHPDFLDIFIALTGRAPYAGVYLEENRKADCVIEVKLPEVYNDAIWPMLGWCVGKLSPDSKPILTGLEGASPTADDLRAICAAFGTTSAAPMLHINGITPEGSSQDTKDLPKQKLGLQDFRDAWNIFNSGPTKIDLVALGSPHFSIDEAHRFAELMKGKTCHSETKTIITLSRESKAAIEADGCLASLSSAGVQVVCDLCWCSITEPVFPPQAKTLMTNSGKYAHYAPGLSGRQVRFGSLSDCATAAIHGFVPKDLPDWLQ